MATVLNSILLMPMFQRSHIISFTSNITWFGMIQCLAPTLISTLQIRMIEYHLMIFLHFLALKIGTLQGTNISPQNGILKMIFLFPRWDMLIPWRVYVQVQSEKTAFHDAILHHLRIASKPYMPWFGFHSTLVFSMIFFSKKNPRKLPRLRNKKTVDFLRDAPS